MFPAWPCAAQRSALGQSIPKGRMCHVAVIAQNMALAGWHSAGKFNARNKGHAFWQMLCQLFCPYYRVVVGEGEYLDARGFHVPRKLDRRVCPVGSGGVHMQINHTGHPPCLQYDPRYNKGWQQLFPPRGIPSYSHFPVGCKQSITQIGAVFNSFFWRPAPVSDEEKYWFTRSKEHDIIPPAKARRPKTRLRAFQEVMFYGIGTYEGSGHGPVGDPGAV